MKIALIGHPLGHSRSAELFAALAEVGGPRIEYVPVDTPPEKLVATLERLRAGEWDGANVTIPHKVSVNRLLNGRGPKATAANAVNTIVCDGDNLIGSNTDGVGFLAALEYSPRVLERLNKLPRRALVLGINGGAGRAVAVMLSQAGWVVLGVTRAVEAAQSLVPSHARGVMNWDDPDLIDAAQLCSLIVQATPLGMGSTAKKKVLPPFPAEGFNPDQVVVDLIYEPWETPFLALARQHGALGMNGWPMLVRQAAGAVELWTGETWDDQMLAAAARVEKRDPLAK